ncbi:MAG: sodium:calcium antiporter [Aureispira sp.]|nr:sodium:calcium antiporter [Aureispira sp.]
MLFSDNIWWNGLLGIFGVIVLIISAKVIVERLIGVAHHYGFSESFVGLTVLSIGTSLPEIGSHVTASMGILSGQLDYQVASSMVLGANIGSDVVQQTLILGIVVFLMGTITFTQKFLYESYSVMIGTTLITLLLGWDGMISRTDGGILLILFVAYMYFLYNRQTPKEHNDSTAQKLTNPIWVELLVILIGLSTLLFSSILALSATEFIVEHTGVGGSMIGVISLGVASALPELFTAIQGLRNKSMGISVGTLIGSNITNPLVAIGLGGVISTFYVPKPLVHWDLPVETISAALLLCWLRWSKGKLGRGGAIYLVVLYFVYLWIRIQYFSVD